MIDNKKNPSEIKLVIITETFSISEKQIDDLKSKYGLEEILCYDFSGKKFVTRVTCYPFPARYIELRLKDGESDKLDEIAHDLKELIGRELVRTSYPEVLSPGVVLYQIGKKGGMEV